MERATLKRHSTTGPAKSRGRYYEGQESVVPTKAGLRPTLVTKELYVQAGAEAEALTLADFDQPRGAGGECFHIGAFGHEEHLVEGDRREV